MKAEKKDLIGRISLLFAAFIWGSSFIIMKNSVDIFQPHLLLAIRFTLGTAILCAIFFKRLKKIDKSYIKSGIIIGTCLFLAYSTQTIGITETSAGKNAFLTAVYCVIAPFLFWIFDKRRPDMYNFLAAFLCITGIGLCALSERLTIGFGDTFTLIGGFFYAMHLVMIVKHSGGKDPVVITILQFATAMVFSWAVGLSTESFPAAVPVKSALGLCYLGVFPTAVCLLLQNIGQKYTPLAPAAILLSLESVFGVLFSVLLGGEVLSFRIVMGFVCIFFAVIISETKLRFLKKKNKAVKQ